MASSVRSVYREIEAERARERENEEVRERVETGRDELLLRVATSRRV